MFIPLLTRPLVADYRGDETTVLLVEAWLGVTVERAREIAVIAPGRTVMILLDSESWIDHYGFDVDRAAATRRNMEWAGVRADTIEIVPISLGHCEIGCTAARAEQTAQLLRRKRIATATLVGEGLHSGRSCYAYRAALGPEITLDCYPTAVGPGQQDYWQTPYGVLEVGLEYVKLAYYLSRGLL